MRTAQVFPTGLGGAASARMLISALAAMLVSSPALAATHPITPQEISTLRQVSDAQIAPDGHQILYSRITPSNHTAPTAPEIWAVTPGSHEEPKRLRGTLTGDHQPRWSPDGATLALLRTHDTCTVHGARLVLLDPHTLVLDEATSLLDPRAARRWPFHCRHHP